MKILLTGGNGFLGSYFRELLSKHNQIFNLSKSNSDFNCNLEIEIPTFTIHFDFERLIGHQSNLIE